MFKSCSPYLKLLGETEVEWHLSLTPSLIERAVEEDKLIFLHIGEFGNIAARERAERLFNNPNVVKFLNENFISILEDRVDRPESYLLGLNLLFLNNDFSHGPINIFLMSDRKPIIAFSNCEIDNFLELANSLLMAKEEKLEKLEQLATMLSEQAQETGITTPSAQQYEISDSLLNAYLSSWFNSLFINGLLYKFKPFTPDPSSLYTALLYLEHYPNKRYSEMIEQILDHLQYSNLFDVVDGGFFYQAEDYSCTLPLFSKKVEENSRFLILYAAAYHYYKKNSYLESALKIYSFIKEQLTLPNGGLANSVTLLGESDERDYYYYTPNELTLLLPDRVLEIMGAIGIDSKLGKRKKQLPKRLPNSYIHLTKAELSLLQERRREHRSFYRDERVLTSSTAVTIVALIKAYNYIGDNKLIDDAKSLYSFLLKHNMTLQEGHLLRYSDCEETKIEGYSSDWAHFIEASIELYKIEDDESYLSNSLHLTNLMLKRFYKKENGMFSKSDLKSNSETVPYKRESNLDLFRPSANSVMAGNLLSLYQITGEKNYSQIAFRQISNLVPSLLQSSALLSSWAEKLLIAKELQRGSSSIE